LVTWVTAWPVGCRVACWSYQEGEVLLAHGLCTVDGLADDVGVTGVLGGLSHNVDECAAGRPTRAVLKPRGLGKWVRCIERRQGDYQRIGELSNNLVASDQVRQRLLVRHTKAGCMSLVGGLVGRAVRFWALLDEADPSLFDERDVLDNASQTELAGGGGQPTLGIR